MEAKDSQKVNPVVEQTVNTPVVQPTDSPQPNKNEKRKGGFLKKLFWSIFILFLCTGVTSVLLGFLWMGGYLKLWTCEIVYEDSMIWERFSCEDVNGTDLLPNPGDGDNQEPGENKYIPGDDAEATIINVIDESIKSVVGVGLYGGRFSEERIVGTGFVVDEQGWIITNQHVVSRGQTSDYFVLLNGQQEPINVEEIFRDEINDIALLKVASDNLPAIRLGDSDGLHVGQTAIAIGNPLGSLSGTVTVGVVSALDRDVEVGDDFNFNIRSYSEVIQTDASINPGNSGGPLINSRGEVIGVNFATVSGADNLSFALPINRVKARIAEVQEFGGFRIPFLGVEYQRRLIFYQNESTIGAVIANVIENSPADQAGLVTGDVIVQYDGQSLEDQSLVNLIQQSEIDEVVEVVVIRNNEIETVDVTIGDRSSFE